MTDSIRSEHPKLTNGRRLFPMILVCTLAQNAHEIQYLLDCLSHFQLLNDNYRVLNEGLNPKKIATWGV